MKGVRTKKINNSIYIMEMIITRFELHTYLLLSTRTTLTC